MRPLRSFAFAAAELRAHALELRALYLRALEREHRTKAEVYKHAMQLAERRALELDAVELETAERD